MFDRYFQTKSFYFSQDYDLTRPFSVSASRTFRLGDYDDRFYYNSAFTGKLREHNLEHWVQPFICGLVEQRLLNINQKALSFILISRRDKSRAGMRFISRGADTQGNVSNFAETEQLLTFLNDDSYDVYSYLQTRGSIPLIWRQPPNLKWSPKLLIESNAMKNKSAYKYHIDRQKKLYGDNHLVNLIDKKGSQKIIGEAFSERVKTENDPAIKYSWFDFHAECKNMQWHHLSKLVNEVVDSIQKFKYGQYKVYKTVGYRDWQNHEAEIPRIMVLQTQTGVFRTNCMDCLDRTNVVQSVLGRNILLSQLHSVCSSDHRLESFRDPTVTRSRNCQEILKKPSESSGQTTLTGSVCCTQARVLSKSILLDMEREARLVR
jgi:hypothetical protein